MAMAVLIFCISFPNSPGFILKKKIFYATKCIKLIGNPREMPDDAAGFFLQMEQTAGMAIVKCSLPSGTITSAKLDAGYEVMSFLFISVVSKKDMYVEPPPLSGRF